MISVRLIKVVKYDDSHEYIFKTSRAFWRKKIAILHAYIPCIGEGVVFLDGEHDVNADLGLHCSLGAGKNGLRYEGKHRIRKIKIPDETMLYS